jgi:hypothetical protein
MATAFAALSSANPITVSKRQNSGNGPFAPAVRPPFPKHLPPPAHN